MIQFDLPKQKSSIIKVLGVGGGGSNAVNFMFQQDIEGVDFIICNTDSKAIEQSLVPNKIQLGPHLTQGLGAGSTPEAWAKMMNLQNPLMQGLMGNYMEQSKDLFVKMQEQLQGSQNLFGNFPFTPPPTKSEKE